MAGGRFGAANGGGGGGSCFGDNSATRPLLPGIFAVTVGISSDRSGVESLDSDEVADDVDEMADDEDMLAAALIAEDTWLLWW